MIVDWAGGLVHLQSVVVNLAAGSQGVRAFEHCVSMTMRHLGNMKPYHTTVADDLQDALA